jgi:DNA-binding MarR family transcriptional regulator
MPSTFPGASSSVAFSDQELAAWRGMLMAYARVTQALDAQMRNEHGLPVSAYEVLMFLGDSAAGRLRMAEIAQRVLLSRSGVTRLVDRLVELGYVTRCAAENDGRGLYAELTDAGTEKLEAARRTHREGVRIFFLNDLNVTDQIALGDIWTRFLETTGTALRPRARPFPAGAVLERHDDVLAGGDVEQPLEHGREPDL